MHRLFCERFPGSSWKAPPEFPYGDAVAYQWLEGEYYLGDWHTYLEKLSATDEMAIQELLASTSTSRHINLQQGQVFVNVLLMGIEVHLLDSDRIRHQLKNHTNADTISSKRNMTDSTGSPGRKTPPPPVFEAVRFNEGWKCRPYARFFCNIEQRLLQRVPWVTLVRDNKDF